MRLARVKRQGVPLTSLRAGDLMRRIVALIIVCLATAGFSSGQTVTFLYNFGFQGSFTGINPGSILIQASDGNIYGTTINGGDPGGGTIFRMTLAGVVSEVAGFCPKDCPYGTLPYAGLMQGSDGNLYGGNASGGANNYGTLYKATLDGRLSTLHDFTGTDGGAPYAAMVEGQDGNFYGTSLDGPNFAGTVFKITPEGQLTTLHNFNTTDGSYPYRSLLLAKDGNFYGTASMGGANSDGTVFKITSGGTFTTVHNFNGTDGRDPLAALVQAGDGNFYGTTGAGGANDAGTIFKMTADGTLTTLYSFCSQQNCADGGAPGGPLTQATDGNFYGTTSVGGVGHGTIFRIDLHGQLTTLYTFTGYDGDSPTSTLLQATDGNLYGTTLTGGTQYAGTLFRLNFSPTLSVAKSGMGTVSSVDGHIYCGTSCSYSYSKGLQVTLSAVPAPGYTFSGWIGCDKVNGSYCSVTMSMAKDVSAAFEVSSDTLVSVSFKPSYVRGGQLSAGTLTLIEPAPPGGLGVALSSDHPGVAHPPSFVIVPGGKSSVQFAVQTFPVKSNTTVTITATTSTSWMNGNLTVGTTSLPPSIR